MSVWTSLKNFFVAAPADIDKAAKAIYAKADADVASLKKHAAVTKQAADTATKVANAHALVADYVKLLNAQVPAAAPAPAAPTGTTGPSA